MPRDLLDRIRNEIAEVLYTQKRDVGFRRYSIYSVLQEDAVCACLLERGNFSAVDLEGRTRCDRDVAGVYGGACQVCQRIRDPVDRRRDVCV